MYTHVDTTCFRKARVLLMSKRMLVFLLGERAMLKESAKALAHLAVRSCTQIFKWSVKSLPPGLLMAAEHLEFSSVNNSASLHCAPALTHTFTCSFLTGLYVFLFCVRTYFPGADSLRVY